MLRVMLSLSLLLLAPATYARVRVAATVPDLAALARAVGGARVDAFSLTLPTQDPHFADARPHLALQLSRARLLLSVGLQLEAGWLPVLLTGARNPQILAGAEGHLDCSTVAVLKERPRGVIDRSQGDIHPGGNPHYLIDPGNARRVAAAIAARLSKLDPAGASSYQSNARVLDATLRQSERRWQARLSRYRGLPVVSYHRSWIYLADFLGLKIAAELEPKPGIPPSPGHVLGVIRLMRARGIRVLLQEEYYPDRTAQLIAEKTGATVARLGGGARPHESYVQRIEALVGALEAALRKARR